MLLINAAPVTWPLPIIVSNASELRGAPSGKKRVPTIPGAGLGSIPLVETLTLSRTKTQVNPPVAVPDIAKTDA